MDNMVTATAPPTDECQLRAMQPRDTLNDGSEDLVDAMDGGGGGGDGDQRDHSTSTASIKTHLETAALNLTSAALVGAKKRKALRVVKHQQMMTPSKMETSDSGIVCESGSDLNTTPPTVKNGGGGGGNTSLDTGVSSDLSESRPSLNGSERCDDDHESDLSGDESGGEFDAVRGARYSDSVRASRKRLMDHGDEDEEEEDGEDCGEERHHQRRRRQQQQRGHSSAKRPLLQLEERIACPECGDHFSCRTNLIRHVERAHPTLPSTYPPHPLWSGVGGGGGGGRGAASSVKDLADIPAILQLAQAQQSLLPAAPPPCPRSSAGSHAYSPSSEEQQQQQLKDYKDQLLNTSTDEYKNEEDDPFSAVLREMKLKGEFPCRLCDAVFPNLRALKGHNRNHLTAAPYCCNMCPKTSNDKGALIRHMRTHNGERPYECRECQYAFTTKANCERHLRNRHGKVNRDELRAAIIYHLSEDSSLNKSTEDQGSIKSSSGGGGGEQRSGAKSSAGGGGGGSTPFFSKSMVDFTRNLLLDLTSDGSVGDGHTNRHGHSPDNSNTGYDRNDSVNRRCDDMDDDSTDYPSEDEMEQDGPLDLTVDVLDLRKRRHEDTSATTTGHPGAALALDTKANPPVFPAPYFGSAYSGASLAGLPFFYPGLGGASYSAFFESKLAEMGNPAMDLSALALAAAHHDAIRQAQAQTTKLPSGNGQDNLLMPVKHFAEEVVQRISPAVKPELKKSAPAPAPLAPPPPPPASATDSVKMVLKNGVLVKKQKQRRYRTERPFGCEHCTARFTLRSNMERHIKQQHPDVWSTRPRGHRRSACSLPAAKTVPAVAEIKSAKEAVKGAPISDQVRHAIAQQLKMKRSGSAGRGDKRTGSSETGHSDDDEDDEEMMMEEEEEEDDGALVIDEAKDVSSATAAAAAAAAESQIRRGEAADLASVSKLLNNAVAQSFQQYFQPEEAKSATTTATTTTVGGGESEAGTDEPDDGDCTSSDGGHQSGSEEGGARSDGGGGGGSGGTGQVTKKKSAYSNAPHRVSCPYCSRKFPWTSSLRRHILTHTGQKPYKCPQCPLWFTTKSNCDRHLLRKHGNNNDANSSRNVPDRPFKCALCPSSTFATSDNLKKHVDNKHCPGHSSAESQADGCSDDEFAPAAAVKASPGRQQMAHSSPHAATPVDPQQDAAASATPEPLPFKCHLCEEGYAERAEVLAHLQKIHPEEFTVLVSKGALEAGSNSCGGAPTNGHSSDEGEDYDSVRGKFPEYVNRKVTCAFCLRRFWSAEDLRRHMRTHTGERPFQCEICHRRFTLKHSMLRHRRKHDASDGGGDDDTDDEEDAAAESSSQPDKSSGTTGKVVQMQAKMLKMRQCGSDLIGNLLGLPDASLVEQLMSKPADDAARLLGVTDNRV